jgi:hypothetical protein
MNIKEEEECGVPVLELGVHMVTEAVAQMSMQHNCLLDVISSWFCLVAFFESTFFLEKRKSRDCEKTRASSKTPQKISK